MIDETSGQLSFGSANILLLNLILSWNILLYFIQILDI